MADERKPLASHRAPEQSGEDLSARVQQLESALKAQRAMMPQSLIPEHGAGDGEEIAETWSLAEQEAARAEA